jgi:hypothetical protein
VLGATPVSQSAAAPPPKLAMQPWPIAYASMPHLLVDALQHALKLIPNIAAGAGQFFFGGGTVHPDADIQPQVMVDVSQHGVASIAEGRNDLS